jgi:hypothetical protein
MILAAISVTVLMALIWMKMGSHVFIPVLNALNCPLQEMELSHVHPHLMVSTAVSSAMMDLSFLAVMIHHLRHVLMACGVMSCTKKKFLIAKLLKTLGSILTHFLTILVIATLMPAMTQTPVTCSEQCLDLVQAQQLLTVPLPRRDLQINSD